MAGIVALRVATHARSRTLKTTGGSTSSTQRCCALATLRSAIDASVDPREELAFQTQLSDYARTSAKKTAASQHGPPERHLLTGPQLATTMPVCPTRTRNRRTGRRVATVDKFELGSERESSLWTVVG
jgi:hypothetical protein